MAKGSRAPLHPSLEPGQDLPRRESLRRSRGKPLSVALREFEPGRSRGAPAPLRAEARAEVGVRHVVAAGLVETMVLDVERRAESAAGVVRRRLDEDLLERTLPKDSAVHHRVESDPSRETEAFLARHPRELPHEMEHGLFERPLNARGDVVVALLNLLVRTPRRPEYFLDLLGIDVVLRQVMVEVGDVELEARAAVRPEHVLAGENRRTSARHRRPFP